MTKKMYPNRGEVYTLEKIIHKLDLRDSPSLGFELRGREGVLQDSHLTRDELLSVPGLAHTKWRYERETFEWIPVFTYAGGTPLEEVVDVEPYLDPVYHTDNGRTWWATPKGFPREQVLLKD